MMKQSTLTITEADLFFGYNTSIHGMACFTTSYFLFDTLYIVIYQRWLTFPLKDIVLHHLACLLPTLIAIYTQRYLPFINNCFIAEIQTIFIHM